MEKLAQIIGLSFTDMVDITTWAFCLVMFGVCFGIALYDFFGWFGDLMSSLVNYLLSFILERFPDVRKSKEK